MKEILLDTHVIIWALTDDRRLTASIREIISDPENMIYYSTASLWEIAVKNYKAPEKCPYNEKDIDDLCQKSGYHCLNILANHIKNLRHLKVKSGNVLANYDPFDRMLIAQAKSQEFYILSHDSNFENYDEPCIITF